jgi:dCMP deaminase
MNQILSHIFEMCQSNQIDPKLVFAELQQYFLLRSSIERPSRELLHMRTSVMWGERSTCKRPNRKIGCVITTEDMTRILSLGYNGPSRRLPNYACNNEIGCNCNHAEANALIKVDDTVLHKKLFVSMSPCLQCATMITQANIDIVYYHELYRDTSGLTLLDKCGVNIIQIKDLY